jgi:hypothetical protein
MTIERIHKGKLSPFPYLSNRVSKLSKATDILTEPNLPYPLP